MKPGLGLSYTTPVLEVPVSGTLAVYCVMLKCGAAVNDTVTLAVTKCTTLDDESTGFAA